MPTPMVSLLGPTESHSTFATRNGSIPKSAFRPCLSLPAQTHRQTAPTVCKAQQDRAEGLGRNIAAIAASTLMLLSSGGPAMADMSMCAAETSNATVQASAGVNTVLGEQNQAVQRASDEAKREVDKKAPLSAQKEH